MTPLDWVTLGASTTLVVYATVFASSRAVVTRQAAWALAPWPPLVRLMLLVHGLISITFVAQAIVILVQVHMHHHAWTPRLIYPIIASFAAWTIILWATIDDMYKFAKLHWTAYTFWVLAAAAETAIVWADTLQGDSQATLFLVSEGIGITRVALVWSLLMLALIQVGQASESTHEERTPLVRHANNNSNPIPVTTTTPSPSSFAPFSSSIVSLYHTLRPLCPTLWPQQPSMQVRLVLAYLCLLVGLAVTALAPLQVGLIIDAVANDQLGWAGVLVCAGILVVKGTLYFVDKVRLWLLRPVQGVMMRDVWMRCFEQVHAMSLSFLGDRCTADVLRTLDRGTKGAMHVLSYLVFHVAPAIFDTLLASAVFAVLFGPIAGLIALATIIIYAYTAVNILQWHARCTWRDIAIDPSPYGNHENDHERHMAIDQLRNLNETPSVASYALHLLQYTILCFTVFTTSLLLAWQFALDNISLGAIAALLLYAVVLYRPVQWFALHYPQYKASLMDMQLMVDLLQHDVDVKDQPDASELHAYTGDIAFDHVSYAYKTQGEGAWALMDVSFSIEGGSKVAVIGAAGAGKTTLVRLLFRLMDPVHGVIRVDGRDLRNVTQSSLRSHLGVVPHDPLLITDATLRSNLLLGLKVTDAEMKHVMELVDLHAWAMALPDQFDTKITNIAISNEQKHRIALARALLKSPAILVLDETTSSLDAATDASLKKAKANAMRGKTTLILVHQLPSTMEVDTILELNNGIIVQHCRREDRLPVQPRKTVNHEPLGQDNHDMAKNQENGASGTPLLPANGNDAQNLSETGVDRSAALSDTAAVAAISASLATTLHIAHNIEDEMSMDQGAPAIQEVHDTQDIPAAENVSSSNENRPAADTICEIAENTNVQRDTSAAATDSSSSSTISALPLDQDNTAPLQTALPDDDQPRTASAMPSYTPATTEPSSSVVPEEEKTDISHQQVVEANDDREPEGIAMEDASLVHVTEPVALSTSPSPLDLAMHKDDNNDTMPDTVASPMSLQVDQDSNTDTFVTMPLPPPFSKIDITSQPAQQQQHALPSPMISSPASPSTSATLSLPGDQPDVLPPQPSSSSTAALQPSKQRQKTKKWETKKKKKSKRNTTSFM